MWRRLRFLFRAKASKALDRAEKPDETLDYAYQRQLELLQEVQRGLAAVVTSKKQLEGHAARLTSQGEKLESQARQALAVGREDLARKALERRAVALGEAADIAAQAATLQARQDDLVDSQRRLADRVARFRTEKETIKASYNAAKAMVEIGEATTGLGQRMSDVGLAMQRARDRTEQLQARAAALDELIDAGVAGSLDGTTSLDRELEEISSKARVDDDLARLRGELENPSARELPS
jgi:phage shock protein A